MIRYLAIATAIVLLAIFAFLAVGRVWVLRDLPYGDKVRPASSPRPEDDRGGAAESLAGDAPWALSALPECFTQVRAVRGTIAYVARYLPTFAAPARAWRRVRFARLTVADCTLRIADDSATVVRGDTRLRVPPSARFYATVNRLMLDRVAAGMRDVRVYEARDGKPLGFELGGR